MTPSPWRRQRTRRQRLLKAADRAVVRVWTVGWLTHRVLEALGYEAWWRANRRLGMG